LARLAAILDLPSSASSAQFLRLSDQIRVNPTMAKIPAIPSGTRRPQSTINNRQLAAAKPLAQPGVVFSFALFLRRFIFRAA
jgi:hypothetical protein